MTTQAGGAGFHLSSMALALVLVSDIQAQEYPADAARGKTVYERHCLVCHGAGGGGDGPKAATLTIPPADFHRFRSFVKPDEEWLRTIEHGIVFSPMHSWRGRLSDSEMEDVVAYLRRLSNEGH
jgi:mono/diheme cytochrome c family protein